MVDEDRYREQAKAFAWCVLAFAIGCLVSFQLNYAGRGGDDNWHRKCPGRNLRKCLVSKDLRQPAEKTEKYQKNVQ